MLRSWSRRAPRTARDSSRCSVGQYVAMGPTPSKFLDDCVARITAKPAKGGARQTAPSCTDSQTSQTESPNNPSYPPLQTPLPLDHHGPVSATSVTAHVARMLGLSVLAPMLTSIASVLWRHGCPSARPRRAVKPRSPTGRANGAGLVRQGRGPSYSFSAASLTRSRHRSKRSHFCPWSRRRAPK
jgi:hypothetical protein